VLFPAFEALPRFTVAGVAPLLVASLQACVPQLHGSAENSGVDSGPGAVVEQHVLALLAGEWDASAALTRPEELAANRMAFQPIFIADT
jgi:hypothetical protein